MKNINNPFKNGLKEAILELIDEKSIYFKYGQSYYKQNINKTLGEILNLEYEEKDVYKIVSKIKGNDDLDW